MFAFPIGFGSVIDKQRSHFAGEIPMIPKIHPLHPPILHETKRNGRCSREWNQKIRKSDEIFIEFELLDRFSSSKSLNPL
jgi:hypothetical protein